MQDYLFTVEVHAYWKELTSYFHEIPLIQSAEEVKTDRKNKG